ncbi:MAG: helix-turn-helix domain-containing protein [Phycisphaeraceae bacterium]|nr:helix-turn-helix domain-containing protein [Phycisphaeraceae bacterium]
MRPMVELIKPGVDCSFAVRRFEETGWPMRWHAHPEHELTLIVGGDGRRFVGDSIEPFAPGELVLLASNLPHCWQAPRKRKKWCQSVVAQFRDDCFGAGYFDLPEHKPIRRLLARAERGLLFPAGEVTSAMANMEHLPPQRRPAALTDLLLTLAAESSRPLASDGYTQPSRQRDVLRIDRVSRWLTAHYLEPISLNEAANVAHLNPASFCRFFRRHTGRGFLAYLHELRIGHACRLLMETEQPVIDAAMASGFHNLAHFNRLFRRLRGMTPRAFRRWHRTPGNLARS